MNALLPSLSFLGFTEALLLRDDEGGFFVRSLKLATATQIVLIEQNRHRLNVDFSLAPSWLGTLLKIYGYV